MSGIQCTARYEWYQTDGKVTLVVLKRGVSIAECSAKLEGKNLVIEVKGEVVFKVELYGQIDGSRITVTCTPSKIEVILPKVTGDRWPSLDSTEQWNNGQANAASQKNWDKLGKEAEKEDEGEGGVEKLFQIYRDADDDVRRAMMKSYSESCGTVLSTNWEDIKKQKTGVQPPDGMEHKKYEN